jgi:tetratricopeptide (TPR) repeat protein
VARAAAVAGFPVDADVVRHVSQVKAGAVSKHLEALVARGLLARLEPDGGTRAGRYVFKQDVVRQAVEESIGPEERSELHGRVAEWIERNRANDLDQHLELLAAHLEAAGRMDAAVDVLVRAAEARAASGEPAAAAVLSARAANVLAGCADASSRQRAAELSLRTAEWLRDGGQWDAAKSWYGQARDLAELAKASAVLARALSGQASLALSAGAPGEAKALLERALGAAEALGEEELALRAAVDLGRALVQLGEPEQAAAHLERAARGADSFGNDGLRCRAQVALASTRVAEGRYEEAAELLDRVAELALRSKVPEERCHALLGLGELALARDQLAEACERFLAAREVARRSDLLLLEAQASLMAAEAQVLLGKPGQAHALAADVSHNAQAMGLLAEAALARVILGYLEATELDDPEGPRRMASALRELEGFGRRGEAAMGHVLLGWAYRHHGSIAAGRRSLAAALELAGRTLAPAALRLATSTIAELDDADPTESGQSGLQ